jgi:putative acetyltransferase
MQIRDERPDDILAIHRLTGIAFAPMPHSDGTEPAIVDGLRRDGDLTLSLVAEVDGAIVGHVAFSPIAIAGVAGWYGLGPISVHPDHQRRGIGRALVGEGLNRLRALGAKGCALIGDPAYYSRLGFVSDGRLGYGGLDRRYVQHLTLEGPEPEGELVFAPAFTSASGDAATH